MDIHGIHIMSLINQMLRDLESRNATNNSPSTMQHTIQVTQPSASKVPLLIWSFLAVIVTGGTYWVYQYSSTLTKMPPVLVADTINKDPAPIAPYETVLATPNALTDPMSETGQKPPENTTIQSVSVAQHIPAVQTTAAVQAPPEFTAKLPIKKMPITPKPAPIKQMTAKQQADLLYRQAENNFDNYSAAHTLEQVLKLDPRHLKARLLLVKTMHKQGQINKTAELLDQSLALFPDNLQFINTRAQLFLQQRNPNGALKTLQHIDLTNSSNETYLSLLAAAYQQLQSFPNAAKVYQRLVIVNPEKAENWLGLALSQEKLDNPKFARESYQQALNKNTLKESIVSYIKQRLTELR
jgi:Flp pilus assembly protein TadD